MIEFVFFLLVALFLASWVWLVVSAWLELRFRFVGFSLAWRLASIGSLLLVETAGHLFPWFPPFSPNQQS